MAQLSLASQKIIAHRAGTLHDGEPAMGAPAAFETRDDLALLVRASADEAELELLGRSRDYRREIGSLFFTVSKLINVPDDLAVKLWSVTHHDAARHGVVGFKKPLNEFAICNIHGRLRAFTRDHAKGFVNHLVEIDLGRPWAVDDDQDLVAYFFEHINPTLGNGRILSPEAAEAYVDPPHTIQSPWPEQRRDAFLDAVGGCIQAFLEEASVEVFGNEVVLTIQVPTPPATPIASHAMSWAFRGGLSHRLTPDFCNFMQANLEQRLPDLLQRFGPDPGTLVLRPDAVTRCFRKDWTEGTRIIVAPARLKAKSRPLAFG